MDLGKGVIAKYNDLLGQVRINTNRAAKKYGGFDKQGQMQAESGNLVQGNLILHELGHYIDFSFQKQYPLSPKEMIHDRFDDLKEDDVKRILSKYGAGQAVEFRAEMIAGILAGKSFPKEFLDAAYLDRYLSDERGKLIYDMGSGEVPNTSMLEKQFGSMMEALFHEDGAALRIELLEHPEVTKFIDSHAQVMDNAFRQVEMSDVMRCRLQESDWIFSGMKTFHELNEAFPSLLDENGERKTFERFLNDVQSIDRTYNQNYLRAEYNYAEASAEMAAKWEAYEEDGDDYYLQYRTAGDDKVRPEHAALNGVTLPMSDPFWDEYYPPNGWNCRCTVVQVLKDKYPATDRAEALRRGQEALAKDTKGIFHFNPGKQEKAFPDYNAYTLSKCNTCTRKLNLAKGVAENELCEACLLVRARAKDTVSMAAGRITGYNSEQWEHTYVSERADGLVVIEHARIQESTKNPNEVKKFQKERSMCIDLADQGHDIQLFHGEGRPKGETYDVLFDGKPADLKCIDGNGASIPRYTKHAFREQGAEIVIFKLPSHELYGKLKEAHRKYGEEGSIYFYFADDPRLREIKK